MCLVGRLVVGSGQEFSMLQRQWVCDYVSIVTDEVDSDVLAIACCIEGSGDAMDHHRVGLACIRKSD